MKPRYLLTAGAMMLAAGAANAQYMSAGYTTPYCREYTQGVAVGGQMQPGYGNACYQPDGSWQIRQGGVQQVQYTPPPVYVPQPVYVQPAPISSFSLNIGSRPAWYPGTRYYYNYGHGWRDPHWRGGYRGHGHHGPRGGHGHGHGGGRGNGHGRH